MRSRMTSVALTAALVLVVPAIAHAQDAEDAEITKMAKEHYRLGEEAYKAGKYPDAIKELKKAYLLRRLPPILPYIARTYEKLNDLDNAIYYYKKYLQEAPDAKDRDAIKKALADVQAKKDAPPEAEAEAATKPSDEPAKKPAEPAAVEPAKKPEAPPPPPPPAPKKGGKPVVEPPPPPAPPPPPVAPTPPPAAPSGGRASGTAGEWVHNPPDSSPPGNCLDIRVQTPVMKGVKVFLFYRGLGDNDFTKMEMKRKGADKVATIPAQAMGGKSIQYYIQAVDATNAVVKQAGTQLDPNIVFLDPTAAPQCASSAKEVADCAEDDIECQNQRDADRKAEAEKEKKRLARLKYCEEHPLECKQAPVGGSGGPKPKSGPVFSGLGWGGLGLAAGGLLVAGLGGGLGFSYMNIYKNQIYDDSQDTNCRLNAGADGAKKGEKCGFNDAGISPTDYDFQQRGKTAGIIAPVAIGVGAAMFAGGVTMAIIDYIKLHPSAPAPSKKRSSRPGSGSDSSSAQSSIQDIMIVPALSPTQVGLEAGFRF